MADGRYVCQTCLVHDARYWASKNGDRWMVCSSCRDQSVRLEVKGITYEDFVAPTVSTALPPEHQTRTGRTLVLDEPRGYVGHAHPPTAQAMQERALPRSGTLRREVRDLIASRPDGLTDYDLERILGRSHQSVSGCRNKLVADGYLYDSGVTRTNQYGNEAIVWKATA